jgi:hypothetical protein
MDKGLTSNWVDTTVSYTRTWVLNFGAGSSSNSLKIFEALEQQDEFLQHPLFSTWDIPY